MEAVQDVFNPWKKFHKLQKKNQSFLYRKQHNYFSYFLPNTNENPTDNYSTHSFRLHLFYPKSSLKNIHPYPPRNSQMKSIYHKQLYLFLHNTNNLIYSNYCTTTSYWTKQCMFLIQTIHM